MTKLISKDAADALFTYNKETGILSLKRNRGRYNRNKIGDHVGTKHICGAKNSKKEYLRTNFLCSNVYVHRIIWVLMTGEQPDDIDHIDGNGLNNKWVNLRNVKHRINCKNQKMHSHNTSGVSGVTYRKDSERWRARIMVDDKQIDLGTFINKDDAIKARLEAEIEFDFTI